MSSPDGQDSGGRDGGAGGATDDERADGPPGGSDDDADDGPEDASDTPGAVGADGAPAGPKRKRRRRRRRAGGDAPASDVNANAAAPDGAAPPTPGDASAPAPTGGRPQRTYQPRGGGEPRPPADPNAPQPPREDPGPRPQQQQRRDERGPRDPQQQQQRGPREQPPRGDRPPRDPQQPRGERPPRDPQQPRGERPPRDPQQARGDRPPRDPQQPGQQPARGPRDPQARGDRGPGAPQPRGDRGSRERDRQPITGASSASPREASDADVDARAEARAAAAAASAVMTGPVSPTSTGMPKLRVRDDDADLESSTEVPTVAWGTEDDGPAPAVALAADLPPAPPAGDPDPLTAALADAPVALLGGGEVASQVAVRFVPNGRIAWCDAGDADFAAGERVVIDSDRGPRLAWIAAPPIRRVTRERGLRRVMRRATEVDLRGERDGDAEQARCLRAAKDAAANLRLPLKVFRVELQGGAGRSGKLFVYYTSDERVDFRDFMRELGVTVAARGDQTARPSGRAADRAQGPVIELRQLGTRDEAKAVGGIGSCGLTLCCTTWMPEFVPVSIKMAKDQGLSLAPSKVMGQCGRLKCCLVYEQAGYAEMRKGLPKLGKRVVSPRGEGRVVEVDVLRQRVRVSYGGGDSEVLPAADVKPLFPPGGGPGGGGRPAGGPARDDDGDDAPDAADPGSPAEAAFPVIPDHPSDSLDDDDTPTDDPSAQ